MNNEYKHYRVIVKKLQQSGVKAEVVRRKLKPEEYKELEYNVSGQKSDRPSSENVLDLMRLAVELNDKQWFEELCQEYNSLKVDEQLIRIELGIIG
jgi:uncharacterized protein YpiB (UPF0302 family)